MLKKRLITAVLCFGTLAPIIATTSPADARGWHGGGFYRGYGFHYGYGPRFGYWRGYGPAFYVVGASYAGGYGCGFLRHRALVTGSPYWWHRYHACIAD